MKRGILVKKKEFLRDLKKGLIGIDEEDKEDIIAEYNDYIDEKINNGMTEEEAVLFFGDASELAKELYKTYKPKNEVSKNTLEDFSEHLLSYIQNISQDLSSRSFKEIVYLIIEILLFLLVISLGHIPFSLLINLGKNIFYILSSPFNRIFYYVWKFILELSYILMAFYIFKTALDKKFFQKEISYEKKNNIIPPQGETIIKLFSYLLKFGAVIMLFALSIYLMVMVFVLALAVYLLLHQVYYFGLYLIIFSLFIFGFLFFVILYHFVASRKGCAKMFLISFVGTILLLGLGCVMALDELSKTEFISGVPSDLKLETLTEELIMNKDTVFIGNIANYNIDNNLDTIKVTYEYYPLSNAMKTDIVKKDNLVYLNYTLEKINIRTDILGHMIKDLKEKKVYDYKLEPTITVSANEKNIAMIKKNRQKYYQNKTNYSSCEFIRTYKILNSVLSSDSDYIYLTLQSFLSDDVQTVKVKKALLNEVSIGDNYEFTFKTYQSYIDTSIENLFTENEVVKIVKTDKEGMNQIEEDSCSNFY